jgi:EAL domain-containing protein (putative c-di-GMP-specific phosphodiesterase class I)
MDGMQVMVWLAQQGCKARVLIVSGRDQDGLREASTVGQALGLNIVGTLHKSFGVERLRTAFRRIYDDVDVISIQDISNALDNREIHLVYQPQIDLKSGVMVGLEALARWDHPKRGTISPSTFVPMMEGHEIMNDFTSRILEIALDDMCLWHGAMNGRVAINASSANCGSNGIDEMVRAQCTGKGIDIGRMTIEVTETSAMTKSGQIGACLTRLHEFGAQLSIDDFGTGHSSLLKLHQLPFTELKIDKSFVFDCVSNHQNHILVQAIIGLAHNLAMIVVAEGVETEETMEQLREWGCDIAQGYIISRPMPSNDVALWVSQYESRVGTG